MHKQLPRTFAVQGEAYVDIPRVFLIEEPSQHRLASLIPRTVVACVRRTPRVVAGSRSPPPPTRVMLARTVANAAARSLRTRARMLRPNRSVSNAVLRAAGAHGFREASHGQLPITASVVDTGLRSFATATDFAFSMTNATKVLPGGRKLLDDVSLSFYQGAKIGIIGPNGAGKSSFLKLIAGEDKEFDGSVWISDSVQLGYLPQEPRLNPDKNVIDNIVEGLGERWEIVRRFDEINAALETGDYEHLGGDAVFEEQVELTEKIEAANAWNVKAEVETAMAALRCPKPDANVTDLSGGEARRVALCRLLLSQPDALLLDEPTNHLDAWSVSWIENYLARYKGTVLAITHDRYFLDNIADWILEIEAGYASTLCPTLCKQCSA